MRTRNEIEKSIVEVEIEHAKIVKSLIETEIVILKNQRSLNELSEKLRLLKQELSEPS